MLSIFRKMVGPSNADIEEILQEGNNPKNI